MSACRSSRTLVMALALLGSASVASAEQQVAATQDDTAARGAVAQQPPASPVSREAVGDEVRQTLSRYGSFVQHATYGEVWVPTVTPRGWHPYPPCHWVRTKDLGLYFNDQTEWGKIVHHFGRWVHDDSMGWIWTPGSQFSPGWVAWRSSQEWTGWAPLPPTQADNPTTIQVMEGADSWLFQETPKVLQGCDGTVVAQASQVPQLLQTTPYIRQLTFSHGIGIVVAPQWMFGPIVDIDIDVHPWMPVWVVEVVVELNFIWKHTIINITENKCLPIIKKL